MNEDGIIRLNVLNGDNIGSKKIYLQQFDIINSNKIF